MKKKYFISVVFSFWNEEDVIPEMVARMRKVLNKKYKNKYELVFVNDASTDNSKELLINLSRGFNDIKLINMSRNFGVSPCVLAGMEYSSGDVVVYMDIDLQDPPEIIPEMIAAWEKGADVVNTIRKSRHGESKIKLLITKIGYKILKYVSTIEVQIEAGDFKLLSRRAVNNLIQLKEKRPYMRGLVSWIGFHQVNVYYNRETRFAGKTKFFVLGAKVIKNFISSALISFSDIPLQISSFFGIIVSIGAFSYMIYLIIRKIIGFEIPEWALVMVFLLFLGGIILMSIGILGLYISSIFLETKGRPNYIVESTFGFSDKK